MKKIFFFLSAIALMGLATACFEQQSVNPSFNAERGDVKTSFIINVATEAQTKASAADVQDGTSFRGMDNLTLLMSKGYDAGYLKNYVYNLGTLTPAYGDANLTQAGAIDADKSRRVYNLTIPTGVDNMTFYAKAKEAKANEQGTAGSAKSDNKVVFTVTADKATTNFQLVPIIEQTASGNASGATTGATQGDAFSNSTSAAAILAILNGFQDIVADWKALDIVELLTAYDNYFTTNETLRQGSGPAVLRTMQDMYNIAVKYAPVDAANANTESPEYKVCQKIIAAIEQNFTASGTNGSNYTLTYKNADLLKFPFEEFGLPDGAAQVKCTTPAASQDQNATAGDAATTAVPTFAWVNPSNTMDANTVDYKDIMFPAELCYWADSPLRISNTEGAEENPGFYPANWAKWNTDSEWSQTYGWLDWSVADNRVVTKETRAVALHNNVLYGNALAKFTVKMGATSYKDNRANVVPNVTDQDIEIDGSKKYFKVTGILIGGQPKQVEWNFVAGAQADRKGVVYDHAFADNKVTTTESSPFYTMVFDNYLPGSAAADQETVYFAIELENHAGDFYGRDNIIYDGGKFYLAGSMKLTADQITALTDGDYKTLADKGYRIPPVAVDNGNAAMTVTPRVFIQDFMTIMKMTLGPNALKQAYATIPDLRPTQMYFGLSVDLSWKSGATFEIEFGKAQ
jgi:hypothetical protein